MVDQEDFYGPIKAYEVLEKSDTNHVNYLVAGPWNHGDGIAPRATSWETSILEAGQSQYFRANMFARWFAYYLKDKGKLEQPEAMTFEDRLEPLASFQAWPPRAKRDATPIFTFARTGSFHSTRQTEHGHSSITTFQTRRILCLTVPPPSSRLQSADQGGSRWSTWLLEDQRFVENRPDVLTLGNPRPLQQDTVIRGDIVAHLFARLRARTVTGS